MTKRGDRRGKCQELDDYVDFTHYSSDPTFEDPYFGGFDKNESRCKAGRGNVTVWGRVWGRVDVDRGRFARQVAPKGWAHDPWSYRVADGHAPGLCQFLRERGHWPWYRDRLPKWEQKQPRRLSNELVFPFALQAEQKRPEVNSQRDAAEDLDRWARHLEALADQGITDPTDRPFTPRSIVHEERAQFYAQHTERRVQAHRCRQFKPSKRLELRRFPTLKRIEAKPGLTKSYLDRQRWEERVAARQESERRVAEFFAAGAVVRVCPPELTAAQAARIKPKMGRPTINDQPMTAAERKRRSRANQPNARPLTSVPGPALSVPSPNGPTAPVIFHLGASIGRIRPAMGSESSHSLPGFGP